MQKDVDQEFSHSTMESLEPVISLGLLTDRISTYHEIHHIRYMYTCYMAL